MITSDIFQREREKRRRRRSGRAVQREGEKPKLHILHKCVGDKAMLNENDRTGDVKT